jgi:hypothetical protein
VRLSDATSPLFIITVTAIGLTALGLRSHSSREQCRPDGVCATLELHSRTGCRWFAPHTAIATTSSGRTSPGSVLSRLLHRVDDEDIHRPAR